MRVRTAAAATTLALLTLLWTAPAAVAADGANDADATATATATPPASGGGSGDAGNAGPTAAPRPPTAPTATARPPAPPPTTQPPTTQPRTTQPPSPPTASRVTPTPAPPPQDNSTEVPDPQASLSVAPQTVHPGQTVTIIPQCQPGHQVSLTADQIILQGNVAVIDDNTAIGPHRVTLVCANGSKQASAYSTFTVIHDVNDQSQGDHNGGPVGPVNGQGKATLQLSPKVVRQGGVIYANGGCAGGQEQGLSGDGVAFHGRQGWVDDNAREGDHTVTRVCVFGPPPGPGPRPQYLRRDVATDHFRVIRGDGPISGPGPRDLWLSDRSGDRGDRVDVSVRCQNNQAQLDSDALDGVTLRRDGTRLTGSTRVRDRADEGWHRVTVSCDGRRVSTGFLVLPDRGDHDRFLELSPAYGHQGDPVDVHVGCDSRVSPLDSKVLDDIDLDQAGRPWRWAGTAHVNDDAEPGEHVVRVRCGGDTFEARFFVQDGGSDNGGDGDTSVDDHASPGGGNDVTVYPKGAPETGGGPVPTGTYAVQILGITGLIGAGAAGAAIAWTTRRRQS